MELSGHGLSVDLPAGWEGIISLDRDDDAVALAELGGTVHPVAHLASFPLPPDRGDFGSGAAELMREQDIFVALLEYGPETVGTALFGPGGLPRRLDPRHFDGRSLQRAVPGQVGWQGFFTEARRAFCLYVVLATEDDVHRLVRRVEQVLTSVRIEAAP